MDNHFNLLVTIMPNKSKILLQIKIKALWLVGKLLVSSISSNTTFSITILGKLSNKSVFIINNIVLYGEEHPGCK